MPNDINPYIMQIISYKHFLIFIIERYLKERIKSMIINKYS